MGLRICISVSPLVLMLLVLTKEHNRRITAPTTAENADWYETPVREGIIENEWEKHTNSEML